MSYVIEIVQKTNLGLEQPLHNLSPKEIEKTMKLLIKHGYITLNDKKVILTTKGKIKYDRDQEGLNFLNF